MPDPENHRKPYIKKARNILRLDPERQQKATKKLKRRLEERTAHVEKLDKELSLLRSRDIEGLVAYFKGLQEKAMEEGRDEEISDFRVPVSRAEFIENDYANLPPDQRPPILRQDRDIEFWWERQVKGHEDKLAAMQVDHDGLFEDNTTLVVLQINDLARQRSIIEPLEFENMEEHFGGKLVHALQGTEVKDIEKQVKSEKAAIKKAVEKKVKALPESAEVPKEEMDKKVKAAQDQEIDKRRTELHIAKLTDKNKVRFTEIRENELYRLNYGLDELQADYEKITGKKYAKGG